MKAGPKLCIKRKATFIDPVSDRRNCRCCPWSIIGIQRAAVGFNFKASERGMNSV